MTTDFLKDLKAIEWHTIKNSERLGKLDDDNARPSSSQAFICPSSSFIAHFRWLSSPHFSKGDSTSLRPTLGVVILKIPKTRSSKNMNKHRFNFNSSGMMIIHNTLHFERAYQSKPKKKKKKVLCVQWFTHKGYHLLSGNELHPGLKFLYFYTELKCQLKALGNLK